MATGRQIVIDPSLKRLCSCHANTLPFLPLSLTKPLLHPCFEVIAALFQEIAVVFVPQSYSSTQDLELRASQAALRLTPTLGL